MKHMRPALNFITAGLFYLAAVLRLAAGDSRASALPWLILGTVFIFLGAMPQKRTKRRRYDRYQ